MTMAMRHWSAPAGAGDRNDSGASEPASPPLDAAGGTRLTLNPKQNAQKKPMTTAIARARAAMQGQQER